jgi:hypothetical protein
VAIDLPFGSEPREEGPKVPVRELDSTTAAGRTRDVGLPLLDVFPANPPDGRRHAVGCQKALEPAQRLEVRLHRSRRLVVGLQPARELPTKVRDG